MKRIKHHCCFRLERGPRSGQMCKEHIDGWITKRSDLLDYCTRHALQILNRKQKRAHEVAADAQRAGL